MYILKNIDSQFLEYEIRQDSVQPAQDHPVRILFEVTRADTPMLDGEQITWESMIQRCDECQQDIKDGAMFGYLGHQPKVFDQNGYAVGFYPDPEKRLFKAESLTPDHENKRLLSWTQYCDNYLGRKVSEAVRTKGFRPKVSMTSLVTEKGNKILELERIINFDQVDIPNVPSAVMLRFNSYETEAQIREGLKTGKYFLETNLPKDIKPQINNDEVIKSNNFKTLPPDLKNHSRSGKLIFYQNNSRTGVNNMKVNFQSKFIATKLAQHSAILSLEAVYGMALGGWLTQEGLIALKFWCDTLQELMEGTKTNATSTDAEISTEATMMATDARGLNDAIVQLNKTYNEKKKAEAPSFLDAIKQHSVQPVAERENPTLTALTNHMSELTKIVTILATDGRPRNDEPLKPVEKPKEEKLTLVADSREDIEQHINTLLAGDVVKFGDLNYQKASFTKENIEKIKQNSILARTKADAETSLANGFALLSQHNANNFLNGKGFDMNNPDLKPKGNTSSVATIGKSRYDQFQEAYLDSVAKNDYSKAQQIRQNMASAAYQEKVKPIKQMAMKDAENQLKQIAEYASTKGIRTDGVFEQDGVHGAINKVLDLLPKGSGNRNMSLRTDATAPLVVDSTLTVMLPTLSLVSKLAPVEDLDILLTLYSGLGSDSLDSTPPVGSPAFGRTFAFTQDYPAIATGNNDDPDNLELLPNNQGKNKLQQIASKNKREEFVAHDYAASIELARQHMVALMEIKYDLAANQIRRATEKMNRDQVTRGIRALFRRAGDANAKSRTDTVANVAPSGNQLAGALTYTGEYKKRSGAGVAINIAGKTFGGTASNIDAVVRLIGGQTSGTAIKNTPIASFRTDYSALKNGDLDTVKINEITVVINSVDISAHRGIIATDANGVTYIAQRNGGSVTPKWAEDEDGFICLASGAGHGTDPTSPQIVITYKELKNCIWQKIDSGTDDQQKFWREYIYNVADQNSILARKPNYARADMVLHDSVIGTQIRKADLFRNDSQLGELEILSNQMKAVARYDWETHVSTNATLPFGYNRSLLMKQNYGKMCSQIGQFGNWYQGQTVVGSDIITLDAILADIYMREVFGISLLEDPNNQNIATGFPFTQVIHWGVLKSQQ